jgi:hypothetical protein
MIIPTVLGEKLRKRARVGNSNKLRNLLDLRDLFGKIEEELRAEKVVANFYEEAGDWMDCAPSTVEDDMGIIRNYEDKKLIFWIETTGYGFDHIATANKLQNEKESLYTNAEFLLDESAKYGNENGKRMTVRELKAFALGGKEKVTQQFAFSIFIKDWFNKLTRGIPSDWHPDKRKAMQAYLADVQQEIADRFFSERE